MKRRGLLSIFCAPAWLPREVWGQVPARLPTIGILSPAGAEILGRPTSALASFIRGLADFGLIDGKTVRLEFRFAEQALDRLPALASELVRLKPDVIYTHANGAMAAARATAVIPIVVGPSGESTMIALAGSLARPTGNVTGTTLSNTQFDQKCIQMIKEITPRTRKVAVVFNADNPDSRAQLRDLAAGLDTQGLALVRIEARRAADAPQAFAAIAASAADAIFLPDDVILAGTPDVRARFIDLALRSRLPLASSHGPLAGAGGLFSLGPDLGVLGRRAAYHVHRILGGAKPGDLPVERPMTFKLTLNLKTAKALGITIPQSVLLRADEVIQ